MNILGVSFILYVLKLLSSGTGFWNNFRNTDEQAYKLAVTFERLSKKLLSAELALKFLYRCRDEDVHPKFTRWKNLKTKDDKTKRRCYRRILFDEISHKINLIKQLKIHTILLNIIYLK